jgi:hypothetical protein
MESFVAVVVFIAVLTAVLLIQRAAKRHFEICRQVRRRLGFAEVLHPDSTLVSQIASVGRLKNERIRVSSIYRIEMSAATLYNCRINRGSQSDSDPERFILVGQDWSLPVIKIVPNIPATGKFTGFLRKLALSVIEITGYRQVRLPADVNFNRDYLILAKDPDAARQWFSSQCQDVLLRLPDKVALQAGGDVVIFSIVKLPGRKDHSPFESRENARLRSAIDVGSRLSEALNTRRPVSAATV